MKAAIITTAVGGVLSIALIVGTVLAYQYQNLLDVYLTSSDYSASENFKKLCEDVANEGAVLLKNEDDALPLAADETGNKITNLFEDVDINYYSEYTYLSRSDWEGTILQLS